MKAVILAGGLGTRLAPFTNVIPKPLLPIGDKSVLEVQIGRLRKYGFDEIFLATNYRSEYFQGFFGDGSRYGVKLTISQETMRLGTAGPVKLLEEQLTEPFLVINGDILTLLDFGKFYNFAMKQPADLCVGIKELVTPFSFGNVFFEGNFVTGVQEKPDIKMNILSGIYFFRPALLKLIPEREYFGMDTLITAMLARKWPVAKYMIDEYWLDIGRMDDFEKAEDIYRTHFAVNE
jgi:NDP-mannose synthase